MEWMRRETHHRDLGLSDDDALRMYRTMRLARKVDDRMFALNRQGRVPFVVGSSGHEAVQVASAMALDPMVDWVLPYYRDMGVALAWGIPLLDVFLATFARADDPMSGGRQIPNHWSDEKGRIFTQSSPIGTQYPHAVGIAHGLRQTGDDGVVVVYGGEGSTSEGDWHEAMNWAGVHRLGVIFLIENNGYAISVPTSDQVAGSVADRARGYDIAGRLIDGNDPLMVYRAMSDAIARARDGGGPTLIEAETYRYYAHTSDDDDRLYRTREEVDDWRRNDPVVTMKQYLIEERLLSDTTEQEIEAELDSELAEAVQLAEGRPQSTDPYSNVYARVIEPSAPKTAVEPVPAGAEVNLITAVNRALHEVMDAYPDTVVFGEDVGGDKGGVFKATVGLTERFGQHRCFNTPLAESSIIGAAIGMAAAGRRPIPEIQFADYIHPAFDQIVSEAARIHYRSNGRWNCSITIRTPFGAGIHGALYHSQSIEAFYAHVPGLKVVVPSTPADVKGLLFAAVDDPDPVLFLEPKKLYRLGKGPYPEGEHVVPLGSAAIRTEGSDLTILTYGAMAHFSLEAEAMLRADGISAEVIDLRSLKPLDWPTIEASVRKTSRVLIVHEDNEFVGYGAELAAQIADKAFMWLDAPIRRYALGDVPAMPFAQSMEDMLYPNPEGIASRARQLVEF
ncbi:MAG TPA: dehydrogenase E1 component subunit alpha/beta [Acidimicrobiia bacterium]|nr:dehydrogenase E1 component subunit alpha/beta [Acidimicrobiia bacterium]